MDEKDKKEKRRVLLRRAVRILILAFLGVVILSVILGTLNALIADGKWTFGWTDFRYDETGYTLGGGTVWVEEIGEITVDWLNGEVLITVCDDAYVSLSEQSAERPDETHTVRWKAEDGELIVKFRGSGWFFGGETDKTLILRIPRRIAQDLKALNVNAGKADVTVEGIDEKIIRFDGRAKALTVK